MIACERDLETPPASHRLLVLHRVFAQAAGDGQEIKLQMDRRVPRSAHPVHEGPNGSSVNRVAAEVEPFVGSRFERLEGDTGKDCSTCASPVHLRSGAAQRRA